MSLLEKNVIITTKHGQCPGFAACPDAPGSYPAIILYMDAPGFREELCNMARRIAKQGYYCLLPDLYYRLGTCRFDIPRRTDAMSAVIKAAMNSLTIAEVNDDTGAFVAWLDAQPEVKAGPMGCVGHCMSGRYITAVAARFPTRMVACASLYGVGIVTDKEDSPHLTLSQVKGELYFGFALPVFYNDVQRSRSERRSRFSHAQQHGDNGRQQPGRQQQQPPGPADFQQGGAGDDL